MKTTRQHILDHLHSKRIASAVEISHALKMTPANVRHHLSILLDEGVVVLAGQRLARGRGRPTKLFTPTQRAQQHNLDGLACAMLAEFIGELPSEGKSSALRRIAKRMQRDRDTGGNLTQRLYQAVILLNELHYHSRWEAHAEAPYIILSHCPFTMILPEHPELCQLDAYLLEGMLKVDVVQMNKLSQDVSGTIYCKFMVG